MTGRQAQVKRRKPRRTPKIDNPPCCNYCYNMTMESKIRKIGNSYGIVLPKEALAAMKVKEGDVVYLTEGPESSLQLTPDSAHFSEMMKIADRGMRKYRNALRELAK